MKFHLIKRPQNIVILLIRNENGVPKCRSQKNEFWEIRKKNDRKNFLYKILKLKFIQKQNYAVPKKKPSKFPFKKGRIKKAT